MTAVHLLRCLRQVAAGLPGPARLPALRPPDPRQPRRALPRLPAGRPRPGPRLDTAPGYRDGRSSSGSSFPECACPEGIVAAASREPQGQAGPCRHTPPPGRVIQPRRTPPAQPVSPHLADPAQGVLFDARRDWSCLTAGELDQLPALTPAARPWSRSSTSMPGRSGWKPAARATTQPRPCGSCWPGSGPTPRSTRPTSGRSPPAPAPLSGGSCSSSANAAWSSPTPAGRATAVERTIQRRIDALPDGIAGEVRRWVKVVRGEGRRAHRNCRSPRSAATSTASAPVLAGWASASPACARSPADDIQAALDDQPPGGHGPQPAARPAQPVPGAQAGADHLPGPDPRDHPAMHAAPARPDPHRPAPRADRPGRQPDGQARRRPDRHPRARQEGNNPPAARRTSTCPAAGSPSAAPPERTPSTSTSSPARSRQAGSANAAVRWPLTANPHLLVSQADRRRHRRPADRPHRASTPSSRGSASAPSKLRQDRILDEASAHRRPRPPHARLRPHRQDPP